ncbi:MAG: hypothetical protein OEW05_08475 [Candidatus Aminicenantes bacterium]|nr:hypothetical protein [Candidatus Aminicenantes bacterium]
MGIVNLVLGKVFDLLFLPVRSLTPWAGLVLVSLLTALLMLFVFRLTSNQAGIRRAKDRIKAHLLELRLYKDNMSVTLRAQGQILLQNLRYIGYNAKPLLVMIVPLVLILAQLNLWFGASPLRPGEETLVKVKLREGYSPLETALELRSTGGVTVETPPVRIEDEGEYAWRLRAVSAGPAGLEFAVGPSSISKSVAIGGRPLAKVSPRRSRSLLDLVLYPGEPPLPADVPIRTIEVLYRGQTLSFLGIGVHWLVAYLILSVIFGFALKGVFKVEI